MNEQFKTEFKKLFAHDCNSFWDTAGPLACPPADREAAIDTAFSEKLKRGLSEGEIIRTNLELSIQRAAGGPAHDVTIDGRIDWVNVREIVEQAESWNGIPAVLRITSGSGHTGAQERLHQAVTRYDRKLIVVVTHHAGSAGANTMLQADHSIALPSATIFFHAPVMGQDPNEPEPPDEDFPNPAIYSNLPPDKWTREDATQYCFEYYQREFKRLFVTRCFPGLCKWFAEFIALRNGQRASLADFCQHRVFRDATQQILKQAVANAERLDERITWLVPGLTERQANDARAFLVALADLVFSKEGVTILAHEAFYLGVVDQVIENTIPTT